MSAVITGLGLALLLWLPGAGIDLPAGGASGSDPTPSISVDRESFWYEHEPVAPGDGVGEGLVPAPGCVDRVIAALEAVLRRHPERFPQPPPLAIVVRGSPRDDAGTGTGWVWTLGAYGCARLVDGAVLIEVTPSTFIGREALNDAELRAFLGHELVHAYQYAHGSHHRDPERLVRREIEALEWELAALEPEVGDAYREDVRANLEMYRAMLGG